MGTGLFVAGLVAIALGLLVVVGARYLFARLDVSDENLDRLILLTVGLGGLLLTAGVIVVFIALIA